MASFKTWFNTYRPFTLTLAFSTAFTGIGVAFFYNREINFLTAILTLITAFLLQSLCNITNDLGDYLKGTDNSDEEVGRGKMMKEGKISLAEMKKAIIITLIITVLFGSILILYAFWGCYFINHIIFFTLGFFAILSAITYTLGKNAYGYKGWGDFFSFLFFGPIGVFGSFYLQTKTLNLIPLLPSLAVGFLTVSVLNINNIRDYKNDKNYNKNTLVVKIGVKNAKIYLVILFVLAHISLILFSFLHSTNYISYLYIIIFLWQYVILSRAITKPETELNKQLQMTAISTCLLMIFFIITLNL
ncbi:MAG: 1,4-dihydroxy-2-naphthoate octaprenyltransferase [Bacteroidales bacterium]|jgi:1,4-dihydroxy-2-naphthoate octaprenyltransferase